jgi:hypothetical protein
MKDHLVEVVTRLRLYKRPHIRGRFLGIAIPPAAVRVAVVIGCGRVGWHFDFRFGSCGHGGDVGFRFRNVAPQLA